MSRIVLIVSLALLALAPAAGAYSKFKVHGPRNVNIFSQVRFPTTGLKPNEKITVSLVPTINRGGNCCGIDVIRNARADSHGEAILHFRWPSYYFNGPERVQWRVGTKVDVIVLADSGRGRRVVRVWAP